MSNVVYPKFKEAIIQGSANSALNGSGSTGVFVALVDTGVYTYNASHQYYSDLGASVVGTPVELTSKTYTNGTLDAADVTFTSVSGATVEALVFYVKNAGANTTWRLVAYQDTSVTGLTLTPNGADVTLSFSASGVLTF